MRVYLVDASADYILTGKPTQWTDAEFIFQSCHFYDLKEFEQKVNDDDITVNNYYIRFINN